jgi:hypothetical protein
MSYGYTKLFGTALLQSSVWQEDLHVKVVWITMLSLADAHGIVSASVPGLARTAGVTIEQCEEALAKFLAPDKYSRTKDYEGRRIAEVDGGWLLLNHKKYRQELSSEERRQRETERRRALRERMGPEFVAWQNLLARHGRDVCDRWSGDGGFECFLADIGRRPSSRHSLRRLDRAAPYEPGNVQWSAIDESPDISGTSPDISGTSQDISASSSETVADVPDVADLRSQISDPDLRSRALAARARAIPPSTSTEYDPESASDRMRLAEATYARIAEARDRLIAELDLRGEVPMPRGTFAAEPAGFRDLRERIRAEGAVAPQACARVVESLIRQAREERSVEWLSEKAFTEGGWRTARNGVAKVRARASPRAGGSVFDGVADAVRELKRRTS